MDDVLFVSRETYEAYREMAEQHMMHRMTPAIWRMRRDGWIDDGHTISVEFQGIPLAVDESLTGLRVRGDSELAAKLRGVLGMDSDGD